MIEKLFKNKSSYSKETIELNTLLSRAINWLIGITILIILVLLFIDGCTKSVTITTFLATAAAFFAGGAALGLLFGLPRAEKYRFNKKDDTDYNASSNFYSDNANLEEISDWLTKIIIGISLLNIRTIIEWINQSARSINSSFHCNCNGEVCNFYSFAYATMIFYFLAGAGLCFLWARTNLSLILTSSKMRQLQIQNEELISLVQSYANPQLKKDEHIVPDGGVQQRGMLQEEYELNYDFRQTTEQIYNSKPIIDKTDLQRGRWGGKEKVKEIILEARYDASSSVLGLYGVILRVRTLNPVNPLTGEVAFFLHDTFPSEIIYVQTENNVAETKFVAYEAFVVGARTEDGTELELNLNNVKGFPDGFYYRK